MPARPLRRRAPETEDTTTPARGERGTRLRAVPEAFIAGELARLENSAEAHIQKASERIRDDLVASLSKEAEALWQDVANAQEGAEAQFRHEIEVRVTEEGERISKRSSEVAEQAEGRVIAALDARLQQLETRLEERLDRRLDARVESMDAAARELRAEADRLAEGLERSAEAVVERAGALVFEQVRRADAAELERTRIARAALSGLGEEVDRIRVDALAELEKTISARVEDAAAELEGRLVEFEARTAGEMHAELATIREKSEVEVEALAERAGVLVHKRIQSADSRVEAAVEALAREIDRMRSMLRDAAGPATEPARAVADPDPVAEVAPDSETTVYDDGASRRWARLRDAFRIS